MSASSSCDCCQNLSQLGVLNCYDVDSASLLETQEGTASELAVKLPGVLTVHESCECRKYPIVKETQLKIMFPKMCEILDNLRDYEQNILSFWILDVFIEGLKSSQEAGMNHQYQKTTLIWIAFVFNYLKLKNVSRTEMFKYLFDIILPVPKTKPGYEYFGECEAEEKRENIYASVPEDLNGEINNKDIWEIPLPPKLKSINTEELISKESSSLSFLVFDEDDKADTDTNLNFMKVILEILYRIFGRFWVYKAIQMLFHQTPSAKIVDLPFKLHTPKSLFHLVKSGKSQQKQAEEEEIDVAVLKNEYILPLQLADGAKTFVRELFNIPSKEILTSTLKKTKR